MNWYQHMHCILLSQKYFNEKYFPSFLPVIMIWGILDCKKHNMNLYYISFMCNVANVKKQFLPFFFPFTLQHTSLVGGPNPACCPLCQKLCVSGESLMEHMKYVHKDPNASGVPGKSSFLYACDMLLSNTLMTTYVNK